MELQLFVSNSRKALQEGNILRTTCELRNLDAEKTMWQDYYTENPDLEKSFHEFADDWKNKLAAQLNPQAGIIQWSKQELLDEFIGLYPDEDLKQRVEQQYTAGYAAVWTIGSVLEVETFSIIRENPLYAMFLDVACSLYMGIVRDALHSYVNEAYGKQQGVCVVAEHYPEIRVLSEETAEVDKRLIHIVQPWLSVPQEHKPDIDMNESGVMKPLKTQCSMLFIGEKTDDAPIHLSSVPCSHCSGKRCLYSQFGGCHLPKEKQTWAGQR